MLSFKSAFSALEILLVVIIIALLSIGTLRVIVFQTQKACLKHLRTQLFVTQEQLHTLYLRDFLDSLHTLPDEAYNILSALHNPSLCGFSYIHPNLIAHIGKQNITFSIEPQDLLINPKITCLYSQPFCKEFFNRILDK